MAGDFRPTASLAMLRKRAELLALVRSFFTNRGFLEVDTPLLSRDVVIDRHLDPLRVALFDDPRSPEIGPTYYLQTSPEFAMKRLLAAFASEQNADRPLAFFQVTKAFRGNERGQIHNPEFTMAEWYRAGDDYAAGMQLLSDLAEAALGRGPAERLTYRAAFEQFANFDPETENLEDIARGLFDFSLTGPFQRNAILDLVLVSIVEPQLGRSRPTILYDYPADQSALARVRDDDPPVAERFELYVDGIELANGYHELLDPAVLRARNQANNAARAADGKPQLPVESRLLSAMDRGLPACSGCALGFDRLLMAVAGAATIDEVLTFPIDRA